MKRSHIRLGILAFPALVFGAVLNADTLILRDGRRVEGQLIAVRNGDVEFEENRGFNAGGRLLRLDRDEVRSIEFDRGYNNAPPTSGGPIYDRGRPSGMRERQVSVASNVAWIDTNIDVRAGQEVYFDASGEVRWGPGRRDGPIGEQNSPINAARPIPNRPAAALIGRVGERPDFFYIGNDHGPIRMRTSGRLFLGVNDDYLQDNSGAFRVVVYY